MERIEKDILRLSGGVTGSDGAYLEVRGVIRSTSEKWRASACYANGAATDSVEGYPSRDKALDALRLVLIAKVEERQAEAIARLTVLSTALAEAKAGGRDNE